MKRHFSSIAFRVSALILAVALFIPQLGIAADTTPPRSRESAIESFLQAIRDWFNSNQPTGGDNGGSEDNGDNAPDGGTTTTDSGTSPLDPPAPDTSTTVNPTQLAQVIARDAGGHADQYDFYSKRLAETLSKLTPAQRSRVLGN